VAASPDLDQRAACSWSRWCNHALFDGNNRIGRLAAVVFYGLNDIALEAPDDDAYDLVTGVASRAIAYGDAGAHLTRWH
jgi:death-on-curing protein